MAMDANSYEDLEMNTSSAANDATETSPSDDEILKELTEEEEKREHLKERMREVCIRS